MTVGYQIGRALAAKIPGINFSIIDLVFLAIGVAVAIAALFPFVLIFLELRHWFFTASWDGYSVRELTVEYLGHWPKPYAKGFAQILDWFGTWPGWLGLAVIEYGLGLYFLAVHMADKKDEPLQ